MSTLERAIALAAEAHTGQFDKAGAPYILHPLRVMFTVSPGAEQIVAALHDVVEDSPLTLDDLAAAGFAPEIVQAVDALTKRAGEDRLTAARRAAANSIARNVKLADVTDNMNLTRLGEPTAQDYARLEEYRCVHALLLEAGATLAGSITQSPT